MSNRRSRTTAVRCESVWEASPTYKRKRRGRGEEEERKRRGRGEEANEGQCEKNYDVRSQALGVKLISKYQLVYIIHATASTEYDHRAGDQTNAFISVVPLSFSLLFSPLRFVSIHRADI